MKALLFPGQGVQKVGMIDFLIESNPEIKDLFVQTSEVLDFDLFEFKFFKFRILFLSAGFKNKS